MGMIERRSPPIWKKAMLSELNFDSIVNRLVEISEDGGTRKWDDAFQDANTTEARYYEMFKPDLDYLSARADSLLEQINYMRDYHITDEDFNDLCVAVLGDTTDVLGYEPVEMDYFYMFDHCQEWAVTEAAKRVKRWTKDEMLDKYAKVLTIITTYVTLVAAVDGVETALEAISDEGTRIEKIMWEVESAYQRLWGKAPSDKAFDLAVAKLPPEMWVG
jgi:hypothetical protein